MAEFKSGTAEEVKSGAAQFRVGAVVSQQQATFVGRETERRGDRVFTTKAGTKIYHRAVTYVTQNEDGTVSGSERVIYIEKNGTFQPAAISKDGGKTYSFSDPNYPTMTGVAGAGLQNELNDANGAIHKNLDAQVNRALDAAGIPQTQRKKIVDSIKNNADQQDDVQTTPPASGDTQPQLTDDQQREAASKPAEALKLEVGSSQGTRSSNFGNYIYPLDLGASTQDVIKFTMLEYIPTDISMGSGKFGIDSSARNVENRNSIGTVILPIPGGIQDSNKVSWSGQNMNALEIAAANFALNTIQSGMEGATAATKNIVNAVLGGSEATKTAVGTILAGQAAGVGQQLVTRTTGAIINPNLELLFGGPTLRQFSFKFKMTPRESGEAKEIAKIIRFFKQGSAAQRTKANLFLKSPHTFQIQYLYRGPKGQDNPYMNKIKECACTGVSVNYTPENNYATFSDGAMTSYELTLSFGELEPIFNDDYGDGAFPAEIGF